MKSILLICSEAFAVANSSHGWSHYSLTIVNELAKIKKYKISFLYIVSNGGNSAIENLINSNVEKHPINLPKNKWQRLLFRIFPLKILKIIKKLHKKENFSCIHLLSTEYAMANILAKIQKIAPIIYTVHDLKPHNEKGDKNVSLYQRYINWAVKKCRNVCNILCTNSNEQFEQLKILYPQKKIFYFTMPNFITELMKNGTKICPELKGIKDYILFFGRVDIYKGIEVLIESFLKSGIKAKLVIAGKAVGEYNPLNSTIVMQGNENNDIIFINRYIDSLELRSLFENAKCVVYPYKTITQSAVLQFPYYFGIPVIASNLPYFKEQIADGESGFLFENGNANDLTDKLKMIFNDDFDLESMKIKQKELYDDLFSEKKLVRELENGYKLFI